MGLPRKLAAIGLLPVTESVRVGPGVRRFCGFFVGSCVGFGLCTTIVGFVWNISYGDVGEFNIVFAVGLSVGWRLGRGEG